MEKKNALQLRICLSANKIILLQKLLNLDKKINDDYKNTRIIKILKDLRALRASELDEEEIKKESNDNLSSLERNQISESKHKIMKNNNKLIIIYYKKKKKTV